MKNIRWDRWLRVLFGFVLLVVPAAQASAADAKWNVLLITSDDMRPELGCYGHPNIQSPQINKLAQAGVRFDRAYCQYPLCNPSRTSMLTGRLPTTTGVLDNRTWFGAAHPDWVTLPKHFQANGYASLRTGKIFHGGIDDADAWTEGGEPREFDGATMPSRNRANYAQNSDRAVVLEGDGQSHNDYKTADRAIELLRKYRDKPFFLACGFTKPHSAPSAPQRFFDMYDPATIPLPVDFAPRPTVPMGFPDRSLTPNGDLFIKRDASPEEARKMIQAYWASLTWVDWNIGRVMAEVDSLGLRDRTVIVFWGDHGYHLGEKGKWSKHGSLFEVGTRVPLIIIAPGSKVAGQVVPHPVQSLDIYPTLCDLCGLKSPQGLEGHSLTPLLANPKAEWKYPVFSVYGNANKLGVAVRTEKYRYVEYDQGNDGSFLIDESADPHELHNLVDDPKLAQVRAELSKLARSIPKDGPRGPSGER